MRAWLRALVALWCIIPAAAAAQTYPTKAVTIVVPAAPGGVTDVLARTLAQRFTAAWGQQAIVENKPGANNQIAAEYVARAAPDGTTLFLSENLVEPVMKLNSYVAGLSRLVETLGSLGGLFRR